MNNEPTAGAEQARKPGHMVGDRNLLAAFTTLHHPLPPVMSGAAALAACLLGEVCKVMPVRVVRVRLTESPRGKQGLATWSAISRKVDQTLKPFCTNQERCRRVNRRVQSCVWPGEIVCVRLLRLIGLFEQIGSGCIDRIGQRFRIN